MRQTEALLWVAGGGSCNQSWPHPLLAHSFEKRMRGSNCCLPLPFFSSAPSLASRVLVVGTGEGEKAVEALHIVCTHTIKDGHDVGITPGTTLDQAGFDSSLIYLAVWKACLLTCLLSYLFIYKVHFCKLLFNFILQFNTKDTCSPLKMMMTTMMSRSCAKKPQTL